MINSILVTKELERNITMSQMQETVDRLKELLFYAIKYNTTNKDLIELLFYAIKYNATNKDLIRKDLKRAQEKLDKAQEGK